MKVKDILLPLVCLLLCLEKQSDGFDPIFGGTAVAIAGAAFFGYKKFWCLYQECCSDKYIPKNTTHLRNLLDRRLFGQHIAKKTVIGALTAHVFRDSPPKALTMSFHGLGGSGKNYVASMIAQSFFTNAESSKYYHFFNGRIEFPLEDQLDTYKERLKEKVGNSLLECPDSIFVFDEVDMMIPDVLNTLVPFLDYRANNIYHKGTHITTNRAIYIFLSNTGSQEIVKTLINLWDQGKSRNDTALSDFEILISKGAFNEKGGFHKSDTISTSLIDHYVPFLPLEEEHVRLCIEAVFAEEGRQPTPEQMREAMSFVTFGPEPHKLFARSGCKRIEQKVAAIMYQRHD